MKFTPTLLAALSVCLGTPRLATINPVIAKLADGRNIRYLDLTPDFLEADGEVMPGLLHPSERGYQIWAEGMQATLTAMLK